MGLIGTGRHGVRYANHLLSGDVPGAKLAAVSRRDHEAGHAQASDWGVAYHTDIQSMATDAGIDALLIVSGAAHHPEGVCAALACNKPVLVEKPLAVDLAGCDVILQAAERSDAPVMVAQTTRYEGPMLGLFHSLDQIGVIRQVNFLLRSEDRTHGDDGLFQRRLDDGGAVLDSGVHYFDLLPRLVGPIEKVWCDRLFIRETPIDDGYTAILVSRSGARVVISMGRWGNSRNEVIEVAGDDGLLLLSRTPSSLAIVKGREKIEVPFPDVPGTLIPTLLDFERVCRGETKPPITLADGRAAVLLAQACCQSDGHWLSVKDGEINPID